MSMDPYAPCFCGSGKKFKWCCQDIYAEIRQAMEMERGKQHERARQLMEKVVAKNEGNPQAHACYAQFLIVKGQKAEAEKALDRAFEINSEHPFGLLLMAQLRYQEGESKGALLLARRAAEAYAPEAREYLADVYQIIYQGEMNLNHPIAGRLALQMMIRCDPNTPELRDEMDQLFGESGWFPACVSVDYALMPSQSKLDDGELKQQWELTLSRSDTPRIGALSRAFQLFAEKDPEDAAAWHNLGLTRAWLGENQGSLDAFEKYLELETDEGHAGQMAALMEVIRCGEGVDAPPELRSYSIEYECQNVEAVIELLKEWTKEERLLPIPSPNDGMLAARLIEPVEEAIVTTTSSAGQEHQLTAHLLMDAARLRIWGPFKDKIRSLRDELMEKVGVALALKDEREERASFGNAVAEAVRYPFNAKSEEDAKNRIIESARKYYEEKWIRLPLAVLDHKAPIEAVKTPLLRKKLRGRIQFLEECSFCSREMISAYDFNGLRKKLNLDEVTGKQGEAGDALVIENLSAEQLSELATDDLTEAQLEQAWRTAQKNNESGLGVRFAQALMERPVGEEGQDRFPIASFLIQQALQNSHDEALDWVNEGERLDCEHNGGHRRNEYELKRAEVHTRLGDVEQAESTWRKLLERVPTELEYRGKAVEAMLSLKQGAKAEALAEEGLQIAREQNNGDAEGYLMELLEAAKRQAASQ